MSSHSTLHSISNDGRGKDLMANFVSAAKKVAITVSQQLTAYVKEGFKAGDKEIHRYTDHVMKVGLGIENMAYTANGVVAHHDQSAAHAITRKTDAFLSKLASLYSEWVEYSELVLEVNELIAKVLAIETYDSVREAMIGPYRNNYRFPDDITLDMLGAMKVHLLHVLDLAELDKAERVVEEMRSKIYNQTPADYTPLEVPKENVISVSNANDLFGSPLSRIISRKHAVKLLADNNIVYVGDLLPLTEKQLKKYPKFGQAIVNGIKADLAEHGLHLPTKYYFKLSPSSVQGE